MQLFLCSYFVGIVDIFKDQMQPKMNGKKVLFIPTAAKVEKYDGYVDEAQIAFEKLGLQVQILDISEASEDDIKREMGKAAILYVSGGNTFYLLSELKKKNLLPFIRSCIDLGMVYVGESAGAIIASQDVSYISIMDDVVFGDKLEDFSALDIVEFNVLPHYGEFPFKEATQEILDIYGKVLNLIPINNAEAIVVNNGSYKILE
ncbi:Type 1 glutamine amidotransferase-like domain-containing protein [Actinobacillus equuli]|uniref:Type 1 glutamine amidotransferase-like domain-containing protein n=1 Tax=Actinobacillus equuli TaxID=718 RepID=UPI0024436D79|nr:Type 1 glutamine amidotransferase-like domain-containing protein [Actinobacillus equuli]WGE75427.1 Type 1 glutamine amidotransferase-like domain-containing protein [Actinobacillus equuli subsp. haemolyticus]WGE77330.1 Type 1 glutamine amidotransferase-like domain-containing protein [Actinobacillus equuli subsp. haemolyticus]